jgi:hypothetical protein
LGFDFTSLDLLAFYFLILALENLVLLILAFLTLDFELLFFFETEEDY